MWFISRCISVDSLNSCFPQQKNRMSYDFGLLKEGMNPFRMRNHNNNDDDDDDDWDGLSRKLPGHYKQHIRRRLPKRYSDIISPTSARIFVSRKDSINRDRQFLFNRSSAHVRRRHTLKPINEIIYFQNLSRRKSRDIFDNRHPQIMKYNDNLAHRMQAAMSSELMNSLDRNFIFNERKQLIPRSHSFNIINRKHHRVERKYSYHFLPRVKMNFDKKNIFFDEPILNSHQRVETISIQNNHNLDEEPTIDYEYTKTMLTIRESEEKTITQSDQCVSSSFIVPQTLISNTNQLELTSLVPPAPLLNLHNETKTRGFRCRTIADKLSADHKLILKDQDDNNDKQEEKSKNLSESSSSHYITIPKELTLQKLSRTFSSLQSFQDSASQLNRTTNDIHPMITDEQSRNDLPSLSPVTSINHETEYDHHSSSTKIYQEYKKRTSSSTTTTTTNIARCHSMLMHPIHTRIGLRSSTSSSTNDKLSDMTLVGKQMDVCVINQLNEHLSTRFSQQQEKQILPVNFQRIPQRQSYDQPPNEDLLSDKIQTPINVYDEPSDVGMSNEIISSSIPPPPPPPLPVGGFRSTLSSTNHSSNSQRNSIINTTREPIHSEIILSNTTTSTISSNLSDSRILRELRENPLFTRAKQHLEFESSSNSRRLNDSTTNLSSSIDTNNDTTSYVRLDTCSKTSLTKSFESKYSKKQSETIIMLPNELDNLMGKRTKSKIDIRRSQSRSTIKSTNQTQQSRQSELELIFQKRAQRSEQNLT